MKHLDKDVLYEKAEEIKTIMGADELLDNVMKALDSDTLQDVLEYVDRCWDMETFNDNKE